MGWFDEQIRQRIQNDDDLFADAFAQMANLVSIQKIQGSFSDDRHLAEEAIGDILRYYHVKTREIPEQLEDIDEVLEYLLRPAGIMRRTVRLTEGWYKDACGAMLGSKKDGSVVAILPGKARGYYYKDYATGKVVRLTKQTAQDLDEEAVCFYQPFPLRKLNIVDLLLFCFRQLNARDYLWILLAMAAATGTGLLTTQLERYLYGPVLELGSSVLLACGMMSMLCVTVAGTLISVAKVILDTTISLKMQLAVESAVMMRVLSLPVGFFKDYSSGELSNRVTYMGSLCSMLFNAIFTVSLSAVFSLVHIGQALSYAPSLVLPSVCITFLTLGISLAATLAQTRITEKQMLEEGKESGMVYALINGIAKIKSAGAEKRAFARWSKQYVRAARCVYQMPVAQVLSGTVAAGVTLLGTVVLYYRAVASGVSMADYMGFNNAYGMVSGAFAALAGLALTGAQIKPILKMVQPILEAQPEMDVNRQVVTKIRGGIELNNVSFRYEDDAPNVLDDLSLKICPGQYVAIVGKTGCGKSTLMRLLLGFEKPQKGAIYYDGKDINSLDLKSLRRRIGVVLQSGKLFQGDIYSNIVISAPQLTLEEAWEAAEMAGIAEDIRRMPMGMHTLLSEGQGGISGGQRQRLMIARAIAPKPKVLMFDEATSALDNITQKKVSESLDRLRCTRIVIAHRLSTIRHCDRILVLDKGKIVEDGTYEELLAKGGFFSELVSRQRVDAS